ncbi:ERMES complex subunit MDM12 [Sugiyamaella lignohabitans]|uniref:Mitochondrial distribution and morphology protein 12 n=1 Tax=Sugiyamaella lignohabitans TaxID=796027 RepID=A0A167CX07_9ASCO|nr:ERMES complex subunit MDM12 [Sugiyamaella lignohabitans]ANB12209.1 ERMES complex subunit MDM12 [Sugiyamaella lignohabitans]
MSIEIDWNRLLEDEAELSEKIRSFLDSQFESLTLPPYIESVSVTSFKFGDAVPEVTIKHISDPFPEFYSDGSGDEEDGDSDNSDFDTSWPSEDAIDTTEELDSLHFHGRRSRRSSRRENTRSVEDLRNVSPSISSLPSYHTDEELPDPSRRPSFSRDVDQQQHLHDPFMANMNYFHPALSSNLLSNMRSPLYTPGPGHLYGSGIRSPIPEVLLSPNRGATSPIRTSASPDISIPSRQIPLGDTSRAFSDGQNQSPSSNQRNGPRLGTPLSMDGSSTCQPEPSVNPSPRDNDIQFFLEILYKGNMQLGITATLLLNYPSPSFVSLPVKITITGLEIHTLAVLAYVSNRIHFSFICDIEDNDDTEDTMRLLRHEKIDIIRDIHIESEIGDQHTNGPVLRNVGKVEKFLLERIRSMARDELAWPGWITFEF